MNNEHDRLLRLKDVLSRIPISKSTWWNGVKSGRFPQPTKLGPRTTCWKNSEIDQVVVTEGYATGASIHEATGARVIVAFNAGNLLPVAKQIKELWDFS